MTSLICLILVAEQLFQINWGRALSSSGHLLLNCVLSVIDRNIDKIVLNDQTNEKISTEVFHGCHPPSRSFFIEV